MVKVALDGRTVELYRNPFGFRTAAQVNCENLEDYLENSEDLTKKVRPPGKRFRDKLKLWDPLAYIIHVGFLIPNLTITDIQIPESEDAGYRTFVLEQDGYTLFADIETFYDTAFKKYIDYSALPVTSGIGDRVTARVTPLYRKKNPPRTEILALLNHSMGDKEWLARDRYS